MIRRIVVGCVQRRIALSEDILDEHQRKSAAKHAGGFCARPNGSEGPIAMQPEEQSQSACSEVPRTG